MRERATCMDLMMLMTTEQVSTDINIQREKQITMILEQQDCEIDFIHRADQQQAVQSF